MSGDQDKEGPEAETTAKAEIVDLTDDSGNESDFDAELPTPKGEEIVAVTEAILFASPDPLPPKEISKFLNGVELDEIKDALLILSERYMKPGCGLILQEIAGGFQIATKPEMADYLFRQHSHRKRNPLTPAMMETLAIVAYKQPVVRSEIESLRGVDCGNILRALQDAQLIEVVGRKESLGRPPLYGTTEDFLRLFGLKSLENLPALSEFKSLFNDDSTPKE